MYNYFRSILLTCYFLLSQHLFAQTIATDLTRIEKKQVIDSTCRLLKDLYVFPETGNRLASYIANKSDSGGYDSTNDPIAFAEMLTRDLVRETRDEHFMLYFDPAWVSDSKASVNHADSLALRNKRAENYRSVNYGFKEVSNLDGNIGYLRLTGFVDPIMSGPTAVSAMTFLSHSDALIIDVRDVPGGFNTSVQLIASYLFDADPVLLGSAYSRADNTTTQDYTLPYVPGTRMPAIPVYLLTNHFTFSAAEGFAQILKNRKRATLIGETTGGAAHAIIRKVISNRFYIAIPTSRPIDPITGKDWEGTGVEPDIKVESSLAFDKARIQALLYLSGIHPENRMQYKWMLEDIEALQKPLLVTTSVLKNYTGNYGNRKLFIEYGKLYFQREGDQKYALSPLKEDLFRFVETDEIRLRFISDHGKVTGVQIIYKDGNSKTVQKNEL